MINQLPTQAYQPPAQAIYRPQVNVQLDVPRQTREAASAVREERETRADRNREDQRNSVRDQARGGSGTRQTPPDGRGQQLDIEA
jgi:hypothetical protein